ncbi:MAG: glycosyl hydrolase [Candidatus Aminicenantales bacterium]
MDIKKWLVTLFALGICASATGCCARPPADPLARGFASPPAEARPWVYWMWMDGNLDRDGITRDLEAMKRAGIGGVIICEVNVGVPRGPVEFMSPEWRRLFKHVVTEAERLGLEIALNAGPGWTGSGGPWVKPEQSMQHIVASATEVRGPGRFDVVLPLPKRRPAFFGDGGLPPEQEKAKNDYYRDVAVLAFPTPQGGGTITDVDEKALYVRAPYSSQPGVKPFLPSPAEYPPVPPGAAIDPWRIIDLSAHLGTGGRLAWIVPEGRWTILRFGRTSTGANTRPAPIPGLGLECDKLDRAALGAHYDAFIGSLLREVGPHKTPAGAGWTYLHIDSWEMGAQNWTGAFREEFRRRRGYDPLPFLPAVTGRVVESLEISERFLWDLRLTAQELVVENHAAHLRELGRRDGFGLSIEPYDMTPCADLTLGTVADVPQGEFWLYGFNTAHSVIEAVSVAHTCGRRVVGAEAFTSSAAEGWQAHPASMKALGDWAFAAGVNRIVFHRYQHQAGLDLRPGMTMGPYGVHWERTQTWWGMVPAYHEYIARCQYMLRRGLPVADVCYLAAEGAPQVFRAPASALRGNPPDRLGWNFDACAPETLVASMSVRDGRLVLPDGMSYRLLVLPERETMTPGLLRKVRDLVAAGATIVGPPPRKAPGLAGFPSCDADVKALAGELWGECDGVRVTENSLAKGRAIWERGSPAGTRNKKNIEGQKKASAGETLEAELRAGPADTTGSGPDPGTRRAGPWDVGAPPLSEPEQYGDFGIVARILAGMNVPPDFEADADLRYSHRRDGDVDIYFVANPDDRALAAECVFRVDGKLPELWDAVTGKIRDLQEFTGSGGLTGVPMRFEPHQSFFVVFRKPAGGAKPSVRASAEGLPGCLDRNFSRVEDTGRIEGEWEVVFDPKWGGPERITFADLEDWSLRPEEGIKYYSGLATYRKAFDLPGRPAGQGASPRLWLDLGTVKNIARVRLNGNDLGVVWCAPWRVEITGTVKPKGNRLEVTVANLWPNRLIGDEKLPPDSDYGPGGNLARWPEWLEKRLPRPSPGRFTFTTWKHYGKDSPLLPSGLLGPVTIRAERPGPTAR